MINKIEDGQVLGSSNENLSKEEQIKILEEKKFWKKGKRRF